MIIAVGSENKIKLAAVQEGFERAGFTDITVVGFNAPSGIPEQPFGQEETLAGAKNRAQATLKHFKDPDLVIGIESGIMKDNTDVAIIYCLSKKDDYQNAYVDTSAKVAFPKQYVAEARERGFDTTTVGQVMMEHGIVKDQKDPHFSLTGKSRTAYLTDTIALLATNILAIESSPGYRM